MTVEFDDIVNVGILRSKYQEFEAAIKARVLSVIKEFISFIKYIKNHTKSEKLLELLNEQEKLAKRIFIVYRIRFLLFIVYKELISRMVNKLVNLIRVFMSLI